MSGKQSSGEAIDQLEAKATVCGSNQSTGRYYVIIFNSLLIFKYDSNVGSKMIPNVYEELDGPR